MWTAEFRNLGRVAHGTLRQAPLTLLVGQNDTGKSYLATLVWALTNTFSFLSADDARERRPKWFQEYVDLDAEARETILDLSRDQMEEVGEYFNAELELRTSNYLTEVFNYNGFERTAVRVTSGPLPKRLRLTYHLNKSPSEEKRLNYLMLGVSSSEKPGFRTQMPLRTRESAKRAEDRLFCEVVHRVVFNSRVRWRAPLYIPAARTGLMLALRSLVAQTFDVDERPSALPRPFSDFINRIINYAFFDEVGEESIGEWLEREIANGSISSTDEDVPSFFYRPNESDLEVPLHAASSMITELTPFLLLLKGVGAGQQIILEEPEAHLHLSAQRAMARAIVRLVNRGARVLVTTHSDTFVQQLNNLMTLYAHPDRETKLAELGYSEGDLLDPSAAAAYEFIKVDGVSTMLELKATTDGFVVGSLNDTLIDLAKETISLSDGADD